MKVGFVSILGRPNVGKSTLLNKIIDYKISIVSSTPQTTRDQIKGIYNDEDSQIVFIDTPGIHKPKQKLGNVLNEASYSSLKDADLILFLQPIDEEIGTGDKAIIEKIGSRKRVAVLTKIDKGDVEVAKAKAEELKALGFKDVIGVSVEIKSSIKHLMDYLKENLPEGEPFYDREEISDEPLWFVTKEIIRESAIENTREEVPHSLGVMIDDFKEPESETEGSFDIRATIFVERESQKGILVGKDGKMIKEIGTTSRKKLVEMLGQNVNLNLRIKVNKNWTDDDQQIKKMGYGNK